MFQKVFCVYCLLILAPVALFSQKLTPEFEGVKLLQKERNRGFSEVSELQERLSFRSRATLDEHFNSFEVFQFSAEKLQSYLSRPQDTFHIVLNLGDQQWPLKLYPNEMRRKSLRLLSRSKGVLPSRSANIAYKGRVQLPGGGAVRISLGKNGMMGFFTRNGEKTFFESLSNFGTKEMREVIVAYKESALVDSTFSCAVTQSEAYAEQVRGQVESRAICPDYYELEIATAATYERYLAQGASIGGVNQHIIGLLNLAEENYEPLKVKFKVTEQLVIDCDNCEPWGSTSNIQELLSNFSSWAPGGFSATHDVGMCFFKGAGSGTVGYAWIRAVCNSNYRYSVVDQLFSTTANRVLIAHELGHNFGANHDASGAPYIMAPSVNSSTQFSPASTQAMQNHIASRTCLSCIESTEPCTPPVVSVTPGNAECENDLGQLTFTFSDQAGNNTFEFSLDGGTTYPYTSLDNAGSLLIPALSPGDYSPRVRIVGTTCMTSLNDVSIQRLPSPVVTAIFSPPSCGGTDGSITFNFDGGDDGNQLAFSIDGGSTYPYSTEDDEESFEIANLGMGTYQLWVRWEDDSCPTVVDTLVLQEVSTFAQCDDQDANTINDRYDENCVCKGEFNSAQAQVRVLFEGFYKVNGDTMTSELNNLGLVPNGQPYGIAPFLYEGSENVETLGDSLVDWVLIEVRDTADIDQVLASQAVWVSKQGWLHSISGSPGIRFDGLAASDYYLAVFHKGHLGVISASPIPFNLSSPAYDFTLSVSQARGLGQLKLIGTRYCLFAGDFDGSGILNNLDFNLWRQNPAATNQYLPIDADGNGIINNLDYNFWSANGSKLGDAAIQK